MNIAKKKQFPTTKMADISGENRWSGISTHFRVRDVERSFADTA